MRGTVKSDIDYYDPGERDNDIYAANCIVHAH